MLVAITICEHQALHDDMQHLSKEKKIPKILQVGGLLT